MAAAQFQCMPCRSASELPWASNSISSRSVERCLNDLLSVPVQSHSDDIVNKSCRLDANLYILNLGGLMFNLLGCVCQSQNPACLAIKMTTTLLCVARGSQCVTHGCVMCSTAVCRSRLCASCEFFVRHSFYSGQHRCTGQC